MQMRNEGRVRRQLRSFLFSESGRRPSYRRLAIIASGRRSSLIARQLVRESIASNRALRSAGKLADVAERALAAASGFEEAEASVVVPFGEGAFEAHVLLLSSLRHARIHL